jgi:hypothetical protein
VNERGEKITLGREKKLILVCCCLKKKKKKKESGKSFHTPIDFPNLQFSDE